MPFALEQILYPRADFDRVAVVHARVVANAARYMDPRPEIEIAIDDQVRLPQQPGRMRYTGAVDRLGFLQAGEEIVGRGGCEFGAKTAEFALAGESGGGRRASPRAYRT